MGFLGRVGLTWTLALEFLLSINEEGLEGCHMDGETNRNFDEFSCALLSMGIDWKQTVAGLSVGFQRFVWKVWIGHYRWKFPIFNQV